MEPYLSITSLNSLNHHSLLARGVRSLVIVYGGETKRMFQPVLSHYQELNTIIKHQELLPLSPLRLLMDPILNIGTVILMGGKTWDVNRYHKHE